MKLHTLILTATAISALGACGLRADQITDTEIAKQALTTAIGNTLANKDYDQLSRTASWIYAKWRNLKPGTSDDFRNQASSDEFALRGILENNVKINSFMTTANEAVRTFYAALYVKLYEGLSQERQNEKVFSTDATLKNMTFKGLFELLKKSADGYANKAYDGEKKLKEAIDTITKSAQLPLIISWLYAHIANNTVDIKAIESQIQDAAIRTAMTTITEAVRTFYEALYKQLYKTKGFNTVADQIPFSTIYTIEDKEQKKRAAKDFEVDKTFKQIYESLEK